MMKTNILFQKVKLSILPSSFESSQCCPVNSMISPLPQELTNFMIILIKVAVSLEKSLEVTWSMTFT